MARGSLQSGPLSWHLGNARMVEADCHHSDAPSLSAGRHRFDDAKSDLGRAGRARRAAAAGDHPDHASPIPDGGRALGAGASNWQRDLASLVFFATWAIIAFAAPYRSMQSVSGF